MPQMAPISWLILFFVFFITMILFNIMNYYCFFFKNLNQNSKKNNLIKNSLNWKW
uniref:ATP synthase complex subunit 8 n=1 Tax=Propsilocerus paradoxus TaxID=2789521 RepID=A0A8K1K687_9DIPT|nr:ATP synthase F0 subunit 8 [Propsilocerus paradoxus]UDD74644.1 ATP synthase F0 subunit 8 [Propsilocerus paradoxus]